MLKRLLFSGLLLLTFGVNGYTKGPEQSTGIYDFSKGLDSFHSSLSLPDGFVQDANNVYFDRSAPVEKRQGFTVAFTTKSYSFQTAWTYTDSTNTSWIIVRSSDQITASNLAGSVVKIATVSVNDLVGETNNQGNAYFVDPTQGVYYWTGSGIPTFVSGSPKGSLITTWHGRVWVAGAVIPNGNQLYGSKYLDGTTWSTNVNPNDPVQLTIGLQDNFDNITALYPYLDTLYVTKHYSINALYGFDQTNFQSSFITYECGCIDQQSIQTFAGGLKFVSLRGVENFDGYTCTRISDPVKNKLDPAIQTGGFAQQSWILSSQSDWNSGTLFQLNQNVLPPTLVLSTGSATDNTTANFNAGTLSNVQVVANQVLLATNDAGTVTNPSFESTFTGNWVVSGSPAWSKQPSGLPTACGTVNAQSGSNFMTAEAGTSGITVAVNLTDTNNTVLATGLIPFNGDCTWRQYTFSNPTLVGKRVKVQFTNTCSSCGTGKAITSDSYILGGDLTFYYMTPPDSTSGFTDIGIDNVQNGSSTITSGYFTSQVFDTTVSSAVLSVAISTTSLTEAITLGVSHSTAPTGPFVTFGGGLSGQTNRYVQYVATFTLTSGDTSALSTLNSASLQWTASSGTFKSPIHSLAAINSFGNFVVQDTLNSGNIVFSICSSTNSNMGSPTSCAAQTINSQITIATGTFVQWYSTFTVTATTQTPTLNSGTVQWFTGNRATPMSSTVWDNRYYLSITSNTIDTANDAVLVLSASGVWSVFDEHAGGFTQYKNNLYHSDSNATGNVYLDNQGYNDNGIPITAYIKTKDYSQGDLTQDNFIDSIWPSMDNLGNFNVSANYFVDRSTTPYALGTINQTEFGSSASVKLPFPIDSQHQDFGKTLSYQFTASDANEPWRFYGFREIFHTRPTQ